MKPTSKQLDALSAKIIEARARKGLSSAQISRISDVDPSQVSRICSGQFKTFSHNVMQVCKVLGVVLPRVEAEAEGGAPEWAEAQSSMRRIWDETPKGAKSIARLLNAIADLKVR